MLRRTYLGLEIHQHELRAVAVQQKNKKAVLQDGHIRPLAEAVLQPKFKQPNISQPEVFVAAIKEVLSPLEKQDNRIAVALPDQCGQLFLLDLETSFKNRIEGTEIIRWHLKDLLPVQSNQVVLDYQVLEEKESGEKKILAAVLAQDVLLQYEDLILQAGYAAAVVDFHSLALYNVYRNKIDLDCDFILIGVDGFQLSIMVFLNQVLSFFRLRQVTHELKQIFQEINRSFINYRNEIPTFNHLEVYLHSDWQNREDLFVAVNSAFDQQVQWLVSPVGTQVDSHQLSLCGALGIAERMIFGMI